MALTSVVLSLELTWVTQGTDRANQEPRLAVSELRERKHYIIVKVFIALNPTRHAAELGRGESTGRTGIVAGQVTWACGTPALSAERF